MDNLKLDEMIKLMRSIITDGGSVTITFSAKDLEDEAVIAAEEMDS